MSASVARRAALDVVSRVRERSGYAHEILDARLRASGLQPADAAFATRLAYGAIQTEGTLDEALGRYLGGRRIEPRVRDALRLSAYELLFAHTPQRAAVHEGVELVKSVRLQAAGLANAVLRRLAADADTFPWGDPASDPAALARAYGHPLWLAELWVEELGREQAAEMMSANNEPAPLYVAVNPFAGTVAEAESALERDGAAPHPCGVEGCFCLDEPSAGVRGAALRDGRVLVCDAAAQLVASLVQADPATTLVEVGAGRGTKTILVQGHAVRRGGPASVYAVDLHDFKARLLRQRLDDYSVPGVSVLVGDARHLHDVEGIPSAAVDAVLVDAPCSGLGTLRRHPEKRWRLRPQDIDALSQLGGELLESAASLVRAGGVVVYSTCTVARRENAEMVEAFLSTELGGEFRIDRLHGAIPPQWRRFVTTEGYFSSIPVCGGPDGHFAARLVRAGRL